MMAEDYPSIKPVEPVSEPSTSPSEPRNPDEPSVYTPESTEKPPSILEEPYLVKMFELGEAAGHFEMPNLIKEINDFVLSEFSRQKLEDTPESYKEVVEHYLNKLHLPDGIDVYTKVENLAELIRIDAKLLRLAKEKEELLAKPISELNSKQLRDRIEGK